MIVKLTRTALRMTALTFIIFEVMILLGQLFTLSMLDAIYIDISTTAQVAIIIFSMLLFYYSCKYTHTTYEKAWLHRTLEQVIEGRLLERKSIINAQKIESEEKIATQLHEKGLTTDEYINALEQHVESLRAELEEAHETISKNNWKKWFSPACKAMADTIRENTTNRADCVIVKQKDFYARVISHYPDYKNLKGKPFGSALSEAWSCMPKGVKLDD
ncbi:hypothetical protein [Maridesulfovibrio sp.]|uniref:hypothetical protein n=1 Tax=unclassified Maridesulfovibrio TaxID=2794999 RepID=UPI003AFF9421